MDPESYTRDPNYTMDPAALTFMLKSLRKDFNLL
jgi:hypothetical protein